MRNFAIAAVAVLAIAGSTAVYAQHRHWGYGHSRMRERIFGGVTRSMLEKPPLPILMAR